MLNCTNTKTVFYFFIEYAIKVTRKIDQSHYLMWESKMQFMSCELRLQFKELRVQAHKSGVYTHEFRVQIHKLRVQIQKSQVQIHE